MAVTFGSLNSDPQMRFAGCRLGIRRPGHRFSGLWSVIARPVWAAGRCHAGSLSHPCLPQLFHACLWFPAERIGRGQRVSRQIRSRLQPTRPWPPCSVARFLCSSSLWILELESSASTPLDLIGIKLRYRRESHFGAIWPQSEAGL